MEEWILLTPTNKRLQIISQDTSSGVYNLKYWFLNGWDPVLTREPSSIALARNLKSFFNNNEALPKLSATDYQHCHLIPDNLWRFHGIKMNLLCDLWLYLRRILRALMVKKNANRLHKKGTRETKNGRYWN